ncbi:MAG: hypothetical protein RL070_2070 [Bacteroidota bacterium]|jgi:quercetin dioxygenase-like cupin family protein
MKLSALSNAFFTVAMLCCCTRLSAQDGATVFTKDGVKLHVTTTPNNTLVELHKEDSIFTYNIASASFPPSKRLAWHYHPGGQVLIITDGVGYYQERGKPKQIVRKGEVIKCMPNVEHWHGASVDTGVTYTAVYSTKNGVTVWKEPVTDSDYNN